MECPAHLGGPRNYLGVLPAGGMGGDMWGAIGSSAIGITEAFTGLFTKPKEYRAQVHIAESQSDAQKAWAASVGKAATVIGIAAFGLLALSIVSRPRRRE